MENYPCSRGTDERTCTCACPILSPNFQGQIYLTRDERTHPLSTTDSLPNRTGGIRVPRFSLLHTAYFTDSHALHGSTAWAADTALLVLVWAQHQLPGRCRLQGVSQGDSGHERKI